MYLQYKYNADRSNLIKNVFIRSKHYTDNVLLSRKHIWCFFDVVRPRWSIINYRTVENAKAF